MQHVLWPRREMTDSTDEVRAIVALTLVPGVGPGRMRLLLRRFGSARAVFGASVRELAAIDGIGPLTTSAIASFDAWDEVDRQFEQAESVGAGLVLDTAEAYPPLLREIYDPPVLLWVRGEAVLEAPAVAVVGTRRATDYGRRVAAEFAEGLVSAGFTVVSGMAYGIDSAAHEHAVRAGGSTVGVLGSGVDVVYPSRNARLATRMIEGGGAIVSEFPLGAKPDAPNFPRRNRIVSGLCLATVLIEAFEQGGALITARLALEQNREVYAVPSAVHSAAGGGTNALIRDGHARLVRSIDDVLEDLVADVPIRMSRQDAISLEGLSDVERSIMSVLDHNPLHIDILCERCDIDSSTALVHLLELEFRGVVRQLAGKHFVLG